MSDKNDRAIQLKLFGSFEIEGNFNLSKQNKSTNLKRRNENCRILKIQYGLYEGSRKYHPVIRMAGFWLSEMGFNIGDKVELIVCENELRIRRLPS